jgi:hypothetical protein
MQSAVAFSNFLKLTMGTDSTRKFFNALIDLADDDNVSIHIAKKL